MEDVVGSGIVDERYHIVHVSVADIAATLGVS